MSNSYDIDANSITIRNIVSTLSDAVNIDYPCSMDTLDLETKNCGKFLLWDTINKAFIRNFEQNQIITSTKKRGVWELLLLFDIKNNTVYSLMKDNRIKELQKNLRKRQEPHYIDALVQLNSDYKASNKQVSLFDAQDYYNRNDDKKTRLLDYLCKDFHSSEKKTIKNHIIIGFSTKFGQISSLKAYMLDNELDIICEKDISRNIVFDIGTEEQKIEQQREIINPLKLKDKALKRIIKSHTTLKETGTNLESQV